MNSKPKPNTVLVAYIPVLHEGYRRLIEQHLPELSALYVLGSEFTQPYRPLAKDIRALEPELMIKALSAWYPKLQVAVLTPHTIQDLNTPTTLILAPDEDISRQVLTQHAPLAQVQFDSIFLRWDHQKSLTAQPLEEIPTISANKLQQKFLQQAHTQALKSSDWWRQVGAVLVSADGQVVLSDHNHHVPSPHTPYVTGDPRGNFHKGEQIELTSAIHAEAAVIGTAARQGIATAGAQLYVTTFPCPVCAKLVAQAGIRELYFSEGYGVLDGLEVLTTAKVALQRLTSLSSQP